MEYAELIVDLVEPEKENTMYIEEYIEYVI